jgi:hypothetical protein
MFKEEIRQIAKCCPQLEHLGIILSYGCVGWWEDNVKISDLVALHQFQRLSSLEIFMDEEAMQFDFSYLLIFIHTFPFPTHSVVLP